MVNKKFWLGILVMVLVFGITVVGCENEDPTDDSVCTMEFKIENVSVGNTDIVKFEVLNGLDSNADILKTEIINLAPGEISSVYKVSGFTKIYDLNGQKQKDRFLFRVNITFSSSSSSWDGHEDSYNGKNNRKNLIKAGDASVEIRDGNW